MRWTTEPCNSTGNGRLMKVEHDIEALSQSVPEIIPILAILAAYEMELFAILEFC